MKGLKQAVNRSAGLTDAEALALDQAREMGRRACLAGRVRVVPGSIRHHHYGAGEAWLAGYDEAAQVTGD